MSKAIPRWAIYVWALLIVPILFGLSVLTTYRVAYAYGHAPFFGREWFWWSCVALALVAGGWPVWTSFKGDRNAQVINIISYCALMVVVLLGINFFVSCSYGDCI